MNPALIVIGALVLVAVLGLGYTGIHLLRCRRERIRCAEELPGLAETLGLKYERSRKIGQIMGTVSGHYKGREIEIVPDDGRASLKIGRRYYEESFPAEFETPPPRQYPEEGWVELPSFDRAFDRLFRTRYVSAEFAETIRSSPELIDALSSFARRWAKKSSKLWVRRGYAEFRLKIGAWIDTWNEDMWQPVDELRAFIPELVDLLDLLARFAPQEQSHRAVASQDRGVGELTPSAVASEPEIYLDIKLQEYMVTLLKAAAALAGHHDQAPAPADIEALAAASRRMATAAGRQYVIPADIAQGAQEVLPSLEMIRRVVRAKAVAARVVVDQLLGSVAVPD